MAVVNTNGRRETMKTPTIGDLVWAILERGGEEARAALTGDCRRRALDDSADFPSACRLLSPSEIRQSRIQPGTWVTIGEFEANETRMLVEYQLSTGLTRKRRAE